jgi:phospholipid/cholesterol/gamma-HCH transport system ATP-binding protein
MSAAPSHSDNVSVEVSDLRKSFRGKEVLKGITFSVKPGEIFVIMGPSGSGKTVLLKHLIGLELPDSGQVRVQGQAIQSPEVSDRLRLAMVFQSGALLNSLTVAENVGLYLTEHRSKPPAEIARIVSEQLEVVGLKGTEDQMPSELSGGMQKRVAIARALVVQPQLVLFDEPTAELDPLMAATVAGEILKLKTRTHATSVVVTHDRSLAFAIADRIAMMTEGQIVMIGTAEEIRNSSDPRVRKFVDAEIPHFNPNPNS